MPILMGKLFLAIVVTAVAASVAVALGTTVNTLLDEQQRKA